MRFEKISLDEGLSNSIINSIIQDSNGLLWVATQDGLNSYDGYRFKVYRNDFKNNIFVTDNCIENIFEDSDRNLWIGSINLGLSLYNQKLNMNTEIELPGQNKNYLVSGIIEDSDNNIWISTFGNGIYKVKNFKVVTHYKKLNSNSNSINCNEVYCMYYNMNIEKLYIGTWTGGLNILDINCMKFTHYKNNPEDPCSISDNRIKFIFKDSVENLWITTHQGGLNKFCEKNSKFVKFLNEKENENSISENNLTDICEDKEGYLWIATRNQGINKFDAINNNFTRYKYNKNDQNSLSCNSILSMFIDRTNVLWIGTWGEGLCKADLCQKKFYNIPQNLVDINNVKFDKITSVFVDSNKTIWMGTYGYGIYKAKNDEYENPVKFPYVEKKSVYNFMEDDFKNIWFTSELYGLCNYDLINEKFNIHENNNINLKDVRIFPLAEDKIYKNLIWIGTEEHGLLLFDILKKKFLETGINILKGITVYSIYRDKEGILWVGTNGSGVFLFDSKNCFNNNFPYTDELIKIKNKKIWSITEDSYDNIWIGTTTGLCKINKKNQSIKTYSEINGISNDTVFGILSDNQNNLWLSTNNGLSKFHPGKEIFSNYFHHDGLSGNEFNAFSYFKDKDGKLFFGGMNGVNYFNPDEINNNPYKPNIVITDFEIFNETVNGSPENQFLKKNILCAEEINLSYKESVFSFKFASLIYNNPQKNQYAYKMEGFDKDWTYSGTRRRVTYTNLDPGTYTFRVKGSNNDGVWNEEGTSVKINISPPYWKTWWFKGLGILGAVAATGLTYKQRLDKIEKERKAQEEFSRKLIESQEHERKRIAHDLHETIAHEILISKNKAAMALKHKDNKEGMEEALKEISEMASSTINDVRSIAYNLHPHQLERLGLKKTILSIINNADKSTNISFRSDVDDINNLISKESEINLFRVIQEIISNIIKHSQATEAEFKIKIIGNHIFCLISDNGTGFKVSDKSLTEAKEGIGLEGIAERIKFMGQFNIESEPGRGTIYKIKIPITEDLK